MKVNTFDIDGVIYFGEELTGVRPGVDDLIVTGRSFQQREDTEKMLHSREIYNKVYMNPLERNDPQYSREASGKFKAWQLTSLKQQGYEIGMHFEDDPVQINEIKKEHPDLNIIHLKRENEEHVKY